MKSPTWQVRGVNLVAAAALILWTTGLVAQAPCPVPGVPNLVVGQIPTVANHGAVGTMRAYSVGATICNLGSTPVNVIANSPAHPVLTTNLYRVEDGRCVQLARGWVFHTFFPLQQGFCCPCTPAGTTQLGGGCSSVESAAILSQQSVLGPHTDVLDPALGAHSGVPTGNAPIVDLTSRRLHVEADAIDPLLHPQARYFVEVIVLDPADAASGQAADNASTIEVQFTPGGVMSMVGSTQVGLPAVAVWQAIDPEVVLHPVPVPGGGGHVWLASRVIDHGTGSWTYQYVLFNLDATEGVTVLRVPVAGTPGVQDLSFHAAPYHSGEPIDNTPWHMQGVGGEVVWNVTSGSLNKLLWSAATTHAFMADAPPQPGLVEIHFGSTQVSVPAPVPGGGSGFRRGDCNHDGQRNVADAVFLLGFLFPPLGVMNQPVCDSACDGNDDGTLNLADAVAILNALFGTPPVSLPPPLTCGPDPTPDALSCAAVVGCP